MDLDSGLLRAFVAVADELHFGRAAEQLFISQQGLSKRVSRLESLLGSRLLIRDTRGVALTGAGERLLPCARQAVDAMDAAVASVTHVDGLSVDVLDEHLSMLPRLRALAAARPDLQLSATMRHGDDALEVLRRGDADVALGRPGQLPTPWPSDIRGRPVFMEPIQLLAPAGHRSAQESVTMAQLVGEPLWFPSRTAPAEWTDLLDELVATFGLTVDQSEATFGYDHWLERVALGSAPATLVGAAMALPPSVPLARVRITDPIPVFPWWAMWRGRRSTAGVDDVVSALSGDAPVGAVWMPERDLAHMTEHDRTS